MNERIDSILPAVTAPTCPRCGEGLAPDAVLCCQCGYHIDLRQTLDTEVRQSLPWVTRRTPIDDARDTRQDYLKPLGIIVIAGGLLLGIKLIFWGPVATAVSMLSLAIGIPFALVAYWICAALWIGHDAPIPLTILHIAAAYAVADLVGACIPMLVLSWVIALFVYVGMLADQLELDLPDAAAVTLVSFIGKVVVMLVIIGLILSN